MYKIDKNVKYCIFWKNNLQKVFNIKKPEIEGKIGIYLKLSTLSTLNYVNLVDYLHETNERTFCEEMIKMTFCRKKLKTLLTFK